MSSPTSAPACTSLLCALDAAPLLSTQILNARDISVASASSFIIVVSVGFIGLLVVCAGTSRFYRQRISREDASLQARGIAEAARSPPELWDVALAAQKHTYASRSDADWEHLLPLAVQLKSDAGGADAGENAVKDTAAQGQWARRPRLAMWLPPRKPALPALSPPPAVPAAITEAEVAVLIAMPAAHAPRLSRLHDQPSPIDTSNPQGISRECAVGTSRIPFSGTTEHLPSEQ